MFAQADWWHCSRCATCRCTCVPLYVWAAASYFDGTCGTTGGAVVWASPPSEFPGHDQGDIGVVAADTSCYSSFDLSSIYKVISDLTRCIH